MIDNDFYSPEVQGAYALYGIGDFELEGGDTIPDLQHAVATYGTLNEAKDAHLSELLAADVGAGS